MGFIVVKTLSRLGCKATAVVEKGVWVLCNQENINKGR
jgi:hypothetical protein